MDLPEGRCWVDADSVRLEQVLTNLLHNASKYTDPEGKIDLRVEAAGNSVVLRLKDNGIGMSPDQMDRLFEAFSQAEASTTSKYGGTGLGLAITRRFSHMMGGDVQVQSEPGRGSTFTIRLPATVHAAAKG